VGVGFENDAPAIAPITTVWSAAWNEFFPPEAAATIAAVAGLRMDANMVDEFHFAIRALEVEGGRSGTLRPPPVITSV
jgi:hypothetical protein